MVDKLMLLEVLNCWYLELKNPDLPDSRSWRDYLTPYQKKLVEIWEKQFDAGLTDVPVKVKREL